MRLLDAVHEADFRAKLAQFEGRTQWPYLDGATPANVTIGVGCLIRDFQSFLTLEWVGDPDRLLSDWNALRACPAGRLAIVYKHATSNRLPDTEIDRLLDGRIDTLESELIAALPEVESYPVTVRQGHLDLGFNLGVEKFMRDFYGPHSKFGPACQRGDWRTAAEESARKQLPAPGGIQPERNHYVFDLIMSAAA